jgi:hypothetical protein
MWTAKFMQDLSLLYRISQSRKLGNKLFGYATQESKERHVINGNFVGFLEVKSSRGTKQSYEISLQMLCPKWI